MKQYFILGAAILIAAQCITACSSVPESALARVGTDTLRVPEYEAMFLRTRMQPPVDMAERETFLDTYIDYRLKLQEARAEGLDRRPEFDQDYRQYRDQLALTFLYQRELVEPGTRQLYDRRLEEIELQHVLLKGDKSGIGTDTAAVLERAEVVLGMAKSGTVPFDSLVLRFSDDGSRERTLGKLGWFIAGTSFPELDDMMYAAKPGDILPHPLRTVFGYHVFKVLARKPARQRLRPAHILARLALENPNDTAAAYAKLAPILDSLKRGLASFEDLARRNSEDSLSGSNGGDLGWMNRGTNLEPNFEEALFNLKVGEVSAIVRTAFGMHIIKVLDEEPPQPYEEQRDHLRRVYTNERFQTDLLHYQDRLRGKYEFAVNEKVVDLLLSRLTPDMTTSTPGWDGRLTQQDLDAYLFRLSFRPVAVREVVGMVKADPTLQMRPFTTGLFDSLSVQLANRLAALKETEGFEDGIPEFRRLLDEYRESTLITMLEDEAVWNSFTTSDQEMRAWFDEHRDQFTFPARVQFAEIFTYTRPLAEQYLDSLKAGVDFTDLASRRTQRLGYFDRKGVWDYVPVEENALSEVAVTLPIGGVGGPIGFENGFSLVKLLDRQPPREKTWEEARPEVVTVYKERRAEEMRKQWLQGLREKWGIEVWNDHLENTFAPEKP